MIGAFAIGIVLQAAVTEITPLIRLFGTVRLSLMEWAQLIALSATPLIVHELLVAIGYGNRCREEETAKKTGDGVLTAEPAALRGGETGR